MTDINQLNDMTNRFFELSRDIKILQDKTKVFVYDVENNSDLEVFRSYIPKPRIAETLESLTNLRKDLFDSELRIQKEISSI